MCLVDSTGMYLPNDKEIILPVSLLVFTVIVTMICNHLILRQFPNYLYKSPRKSHSNSEQEEERVRETERENDGEGERVREKER